jgi:hypothetical protein
MDRDEKVGVIAGAAAGTGVGVAGSTAVVYSLGSVTGLSAAGITSGLSAVGGTMVVGVAVLSAGTVAAAAGCAGLGLYLARRTKRRPEL